MRRTGRLDQAIVLNQAVVSNPELLVSEAAQAVALRVRAMANIGIIRRQLGELAESIRLLKEAARTADASLEPIPEDQCYALDNYGHSLLRAGWAKLALDQFERVRLIREDFGSEDDRIQSAINLARYHASQAEFDQALGHFERALGMLNTESDPHLRANAEAGKVEALLRLGRESEVDALLDSALGLNEDLHNKRGAGIVHGLWARTWLIRGRPNEAEPHIASARELADETGDAQGQAVVEWLQAASALQRGNPQEAREKAAEAKRSLSSSADMALRSDLESLLEAVSESGTTGGWAIGSM
jgi:tetratricopeptide (TPR) repeat protein